MRYLSQTKAARLAGVSRGTIANRIGEGVLSCGPDGIDPAELVRVFPEIDGTCVERFLSTGELPVADTSDDRSSPVVLAAVGRVSADPSSPVNDRSSQAAMAAHMAHVEAEAAWLRELVEEQREEIRRKDRELQEAHREAADERRGLLAQLERTTALLPAPEKASTPSHRSLWSRVFG